MVFNTVNITNQVETSMIDDDKKQITTLGGPTKVAALLGYDKHGGVQRVQNWMTRGIPSKVKLDRPDIFSQASPRCASDSDPAPGHAGRQPHTTNAIFDTVPLRAAVGIDVGAKP